MVSALALALLLAAPEASASVSVQSSPTVGLLYSAFMGTAGGTKQTGVGGWMLLASVGGIGGTTQNGGKFTIVGGMIDSRRWAQATVDLAHAYPVPYRPDKGHTKLTFTRLGAGATIRVFTVSGRLVKTLIKTDGVTDRLEWDVKNEDGLDLGSGLYFYVVELGKSIARGKLLIVR